MRRNTTSFVRSTTLKVQYRTTRRFAFGTQGVRTQAQSGKRLERLLLPLYTLSQLRSMGFNTWMAGSEPTTLLLIALAEVQDLSPHSPSLVLSIGTGEKRPPKNKRDKCRDLGKEYRYDDFHRRDILKDIFKLAKYVGDFTTDTEDTVNLVNLFANNRAFRHVRLNVSEGVGGIHLDDWTPSGTGRQTLDKIAQFTKTYLDTKVVQTKLDLCAAQLVETRRRRAETVRWELFATDVTYHCISPGCRFNRSGGRRRRETLQKHIQESHLQDLASIDVNKILNRGRVSGSSRPSSRVPEGAENVASSPVSTRSPGALS